MRSAQWIAFRGFVTWKAVVTYSDCVERTDVLFKL